jgi:hypothetical protein
MKTLICRASVLVAAALLSVGMTAAPSHADATWGITGHSVTSK